MHICNIYPITCLNFFKSKCHYREASRSQARSHSFKDLNIYLWHSKCPLSHDKNSGVLPCLSTMLTFAPLCTSSLTQSKLPHAAALWRAVSPDELGLLIYEGFLSKSSVSSDTEFWLAAERINAYIENVTRLQFWDEVDCGESCCSRRRHDFTGINSVLLCGRRPLCSTLTLLRRVPLVWFRVSALFEFLNRCTHSLPERPLSEHVLRRAGPSRVDLFLFQTIDIPSLNFIIFDFLSSTNRFVSPLSFFMKLFKLCDFMSNWSPTSVFTTFHMVGRFVQKATHSSFVA